MGGRGQEYLELRIKIGGQSRVNTVKNFGSNKSTN